MITMYTTATCPWCHTAKEYFKSKKISYKELDVSNNKKAAMEMVKKSGQYGVPVIDIDGQIVVGFDEDKIQKLTKSKTYK